MIPYLTVRDPKAAIDFYKSAFGFQVCERYPNERGEIRHVGMLYQGKRVVMFAPESVSAAKSPSSAGAAGPVGLYLFCEDADAMFRQAVQAGGEVVRPLEDTFWGDRMGAVRDPDGYLWSVAHNLPGRKPPRGV